MSSQAKRIIAFNGSPVKASNTDFLTQEALKGAETQRFISKHIYLNDLEITPCQSCGESPGNELCFFKDSLFPYLHSFADSDIVIVSSPIYFDTVSAQTKLFIDRCNCFKPLEGYETGNFVFRKIDLKPKLGIIILVGGEREKFTHALTVVKGFFIWAGVSFYGQILYPHADYDKGGVSKRPDILRTAFSLGRTAALKSSEKK